MLLFKVNYGYKLRILITLKWAKKRSKIAKKRLEFLINLYIDLYKLVNIV
jgi:hypothetical protein